MNIVKLIFDYYKYRAGESLNPSLIRDVFDEQQHYLPDNEFEAYIRTVTELRTRFGYSHPVEDQADANDVAPIMAALMERGKYPFGKERK